MTRRTAASGMTHAGLTEVTRRDLRTFVHRTVQLLSPGTRYKPNWHIDATAYRLEQVRNGEVTRLIINMPPRSLKSIITSVAFPAFLLGHDPQLRIICVSYSNELAAKHALDFRRVISARWYQEAFPETRISASKNTETEIATTAGGFRLSTSTGGTLTGRGGDLILIDDPLKASDALSKTRRESANDWFKTTLASRLDDKVLGRIVVVMQRIHLDDLTGNLLRSSDDWTVLELPAIAEERQRIRVGPGRHEFYTRKIDEVLHPEREPREALYKLKRDLGSDYFSAQYQQQPVPMGGAMIKRDWLRRYDHLPPKPWSKVVQSWDTASKDGAQNDWSACTTWVIEDKRYYLVDVLRARLNYPRLKAVAIAHAELHKPSRILIEDAGTGTALIGELKQAGVPATGVTPVRDKITRLSVASAKIEAGLVLLPREAPWLAEFEEELLSFPHGRHDDQADSVSQVLNDASCSYDTSLNWVDDYSTFLGELGSS